MKNEKKNPLRIVIGIIIAILLVVSGVKELKSSRGELKTSIENLKGDIQEMRDGE